jgi:hypothetical protein
MLVRETGTKRDTLFLFETFAGTLYLALAVLKDNQPGKNLKVQQLQ